MDWINSSKKPDLKNPNNVTDSVPTKEPTKPTDSVPKNRIGNESTVNFKPVFPF